MSNNFLSTPWALKSEHLAVPTLLSPMLPPSFVGSSMRDDRGGTVTVSDNPTNATYCSTNSGYIPQWHVNVGSSLLGWGPNLLTRHSRGVHVTNIDTVFGLVSHLTPLKILRLCWHHLQKLGELAQWNHRVLNGVSIIHTTMDADRSLVIVDSVKWLHR